jgi:hypothetical protein
MGAYRMLDLEKRIEEIKKAEAFKDCFKNGFYDVCPVREFTKVASPSLELLRSAHCIYFNKFTDEEISELKRLTQEVIDYVEPITESKSWWRVLC